MEPIEVNAGAYYLRALRADERVDDRPALLALAADPDTGLARRGVVDLESAGHHVTASQQGWAAATDYGWAVCEPSTGEMLGEIVLAQVHEGRAELGCWLLAYRRGQGVMTTSVGAVLRLAFARFELGGLGLHRVRWSHAVTNTAAAALAARCGFTPEGVARSVDRDAGYQDVVLVRLSTD